MPNFITKRWIPTAVLVLCLCLPASAALATQQDEQVEYDQAMGLISDWEGRNDSRDQAVRIALKMLQDNPDSARAYTILGRAAWRMGYVNGVAYNPGKVKEAQSYYRKAIATDRDFLEAEYYLALSHAALKEYDFALRLADKLEKEHPDWFRAYFIRMEVADKKKDHKTLLQLCRDQQKRFPDNETSMKITESYLLNAYTGLSMLDEAETIFARRVQEHPDNAWVLGNYAAFLCDHRKDYDKAIEYARKALTIMDYGPGRQILAASAVNKAQQLFERGKIEEAEPYFLMALDNMPNYMQAWVGLTSINYTLAKRNNDPERLQNAYRDAQNAEKFGMKGQKWSFVQMQIAADLARMRKQVAQNQN